MRSNILKKIPLFSALPPGEIKYLASRLIPHECARDHVLFHEGSREEGFYILLEGEVEIFKSIGGADEHSLGIRKAVSLLGEMSLFSQDGYRTATVRALTDLILYKMDRAEFDALLHRQPQLAYEMVIKRLAQKYAALNVLHTTIRERLSLTESGWTNSYYATCAPTNVPWNPNLHPGEVQV